MRGRTLARLTISVGLSAVVSLLWLKLFPGDLPDRTDIVGYPIWANFNVRGYFHLFNTVMIVFPLVALATFLVLGRVIPSPHARSQPATDPETSAAPNGAVDRGRGGMAPRLTRTAVVGITLGIEVAFAAGTVGATFFATAVVLAVTYLAVISVVAAGISRWPGRRFQDWRSALNAITAALLVLGLYWVSRATEVKVLDRGEAAPFPWLPLPVAFAGSAALIAWTLGRLWRANDDGATAAHTERTNIVFIAGPILVFFFIAQLPGALGRVDVFHEGELLVGARLLSSGMFPWRDFGLVHGPLQDALSPLLGLAVFDDSRWGFVAGFDVLITPLVVVSFYLAHVKLMRGDWLFLVLTPLVVPLLSDGRLILLPLALIALLALLKAPGRITAIALAFLLVAQSILTPETAPFAIAVSCVVVLFELHERNPAVPLLRAVPRTIWLGSAGLVLALAWAAFLAWRGALGDFVGHYVTFARGHELTGGIPVQWDTGPILVLAPAAGVMIFAAFFAVQLHRRRLWTEDWVVAAVALFVAFYYRKFLSRADHHIVGVFQASIPLLLYLAYRLVKMADGWLRTFARSRTVRAVATYRPVTSLLLVGAFIAMPGVTGRLDSLPNHFRGKAPTQVNLGSLGYATGYADLVQRIEDLRVTLNALTNPSDEIFDFTNQPALFHYFLDYRPASRYYHVSMAIRRSTQRELLDELRRDPPTVAVSLASDGLPAWDNVPNYVRHYEVSDFLFDHYRPVIWTGGSLLLLRNDMDIPPRWPAKLLSERPLTEGLYFLGFPCDWGYAPNYLDRAWEPRTESALELRYRQTSSREVELSLPAGHASYDWMEIRLDGDLASDGFLLTDDVDVSSRGIGFRALDDWSRRYLVRVGSCPQWRGYRAGPLRLRHRSAEDIVAIRLLRSDGEESA